MKRKVIIGVILIVSIILITVVIYNRNTNFKVPTIENINSVKIIPATDDKSSKNTELYFDLNKKEHLEIVNNILKWLKSGKRMGTGKKDSLKQLPFSLGGPPTYLIIELKDGRKIQINSAFDSTRTNTKGGWTIESTPIDGQVTIYIGDKIIAIREYSPELRTFIDNGWKSYFDYTE